VCDAGEPSAGGALRCLYCRMGPPAHRPPQSATMVCATCAACHVLCCMLQGFAAPQLMRHVPIFAEALQSITERTPHSVGCAHVARCALRAGWHVVTPSVPCMWVPSGYQAGTKPVPRGYQAIPSRYQAGYQAGTKPVPSGHVEPRWRSPLGRAHRTLSWHAQRCRRCTRRSTGCSRS
jgi:hypothetical protein